MCHPKDEAKVPSASPFASVAQLVEQRTENPRVVGSIPTGGTRKRGSGAPAEEGRAARGRKTECGFSSFGRARPCQGRGSGFEPRNPLQRGGDSPQTDRAQRIVCGFVFFLYFFTIL